MRFIQADTVYPVHTSPIANGLIVIDDQGMILDVLHTAEGLGQHPIEIYKGSISPGFVNTHCHLELSHLQGKISEKKGLIQFAKEVMGQRGLFSEQEMQAAMKKADAAMKANGIVAVGDISNTAESFETKSRSSLFYHTFIELIGLNPANAEKILQSGLTLLNKAVAYHLRASLVPHAPYSTSYEVMKATADHSKSHQIPLSIHNQESREENAFFENKSGAYLDLYRHLNLPIDYFEATGASSLKSYFSHLEHSHSLLLVHNTFSSAADIAHINQSGADVYWCLCPNANLYIENTLPDVMQMKKLQCRITIGTDSLASNHGLSVANELAVLKKQFPSLGTQELLGWATLNGAQFLHADKELGSFEKGKRPGLVLIDENTFEVKQVIA
jgi:cytosine/adenosine deaminase-related metal-dependent hydrolase